MIYLYLIAYLLTGILAVVLMWRHFLNKGMDIKGDDVLPSIAMILLGPLGLIMILGFVSRNKVIIKSKKK